MKVIRYYIALVAVALSLTNCRHDREGSRGINTIEKADLLAIYDRADYDEVFIVSPHGEQVAHYILVDRNDSSSYQLPDGAVEIRVPVTSAILDSEVYAGAMEDLGVADLIAGMFDTSYVTSPELQSDIAKGRIADVGKSVAPNSEKIMSMQPDAIFISYYDGMQTQGLEKIGIPIIKMYDLQEATPLGRAEWIRLIGRLTGSEAAADSIFQEVKSRYKEIAAAQSQESSHYRPKVLTETVYEGTWSVPGGGSYQASLLRDAGGNYFKSGDKSTGSLNLTPEQVLMEGGNSDIWIIKYYGGEEQLANMLHNDPVYGEIKAYRDGNVYFSNTSSSALFREFPFHPERLLLDYRIIFTGDTVTPLRYFKKLDLRREGR